MQERHQDREQYFREQSYTTARYVIPFIQEVLTLDSGTRILEIGCGEGGNLAPFLDLGCNIVGVDMAANKINNANIYFKDHERVDNIEFIAADIYDRNDLGTFDLIIMRDVLEHIYDQERFMVYVKTFLKMDSKFFLGFPPWRNPFGGHQQICRNRFLSRLPYFHLLPRPLYRGLLRIFGEMPVVIERLMEIYDTRINIERFERILKRNDYKIDRRVFYFINPNYDVKFGLIPRVQHRFLSAIPYFRNFFITTNYYLISLKKD